MLSTSSFNHWLCFSNHDTWPFGGSPDCGGFRIVLLRLEGWRLAPATCRWAPVRQPPPLSSTCFLCCGTLRSPRSAGRVPHRWAGWACLALVRHKGRGLFEYGPPPHPPPTHTPDPPKVLVPAFLPFEILGETAGAVGVEEFFPGIRHGVKMFAHPTCVHSEYSGDFRRTAEFASCKHFPLLWCQLTCPHLFFPPLLFFCIPLAHVSNIQYTLSHASQETEAGGAHRVCLSVWHCTSQCH